MTVGSQKTHMMADKVLRCVLVTFLLNSVTLICITWILYWYISPTLCPNLFKKDSQSEEGDLEWHVKGAKINCTKAKKNKDYLELRIIQN